MTTKIMTSIKLARSTEQAILEAVVRDGYGLRGKSRWVEEAILTFLNTYNFLEFVDIASAEEAFDKTLSMRLYEATANKLEEALLQVRQQYPLMEGVKSNIIRASVMQRLIRA